MLEKYVTIIADSYKGYFNYLVREITNKQKGGRK